MSVHLEQRNNIIVLSGKTTAFVEESQGMTGLQRSNQENQQEAPAYLDPAALSWAKTFPNPRGLNEQHPCYWPGFRDPTRWGLPCESAPRCVASKWWLNKGSPTSLCRPSPTLA